MSLEKIPGYYSLTISDFTERLEALLELVRKKRKALGEARKEKLDLSLEAIASDGNIALRTLHNWKSGNLKTLPRQNTVIAFCKSLGESPNRFALFDSLPDEERARMINESRADTLGIKDCFMEYLKHEPRLESDFANSIPVEDHEGYTGYKLTDNLGKSRYPDEITAYVIRIIQSETEKYIHTRLDKYRRMSRSFIGNEARIAYINYLKQLIEEHESSDESNNLAPIVPVSPPPEISSSEDLANYLNESDHEAQIKALEGIDQKDIQEICVYFDKQEEENNNGHT